MGDVLATLPERKNRPEVFGPWLVVDETGDYLRMYEPLCLQGASIMSRGQRRGAATRPSSHLHLTQEGAKVIIEETQAAETIELAPLDKVLDKYVGQDGSVIPVLQQAQELYGYLPPEVLLRVSKRLSVPISQVYGVVTFYSQFYLTRRGRHIVRVCDGTACHVRGAGKIISGVERELGIKVGETTEDYHVTLEVVYCLGSCGLSPVAVVDDNVVGRLIPEKAIRLVRDLI